MQPAGATAGRVSANAHLLGFSAPLLSSSFESLLSLLSPMSLLAALLVVRPAATFDSNSNAVSHVATVTALIMVCLSGLSHLQLYLAANRASDSNVDRFLKVVFSAIMLLWVPQP